MKITRLTRFVMSALLLMSLTACNGGSKELKQLVKELNNQCPLTQGLGSQLDNVKYRHNTVTFNYTVLSQLFSMDAIEANQEEFRQYMLENYQIMSDTIFQQILSTIVEADASLDISFTQEDGRNITLHYTPEELTTCSHMQETIESMTPEEELQAYVLQSRSTLPLLLGDGIVKADIQLTDKYLININECDETIVDINEIGAEAQNNRQAIINMIHNGTDPGFSRMVELLRDTHRGLQYKYVGKDTQQESVVTITENEMK